MEIWREVVGYEGLYAVSNEGRIKSLERSDRFGRKYASKMLSTKKNNRGYVQIHLNKDGVCKMKLLHRIVAEAFISNPDNLPQVNHKDENKENNNVENLEWCDNLYNRRYGTGYQRSCEKHDYKAIALSHSKKVIKYDLNGNVVDTYISAKEAGIQNKISDSYIRRNCYGKTKSVRGYIYQYAM